MGNTKPPARVKRAHALGCGLALVAAAGPNLAPTALAETHSALQAVTSQGTAAWFGPLPFTLRGIMLNDPEQMLDASPQFVPWDNGAGALQLGGQWQFVLQSADPTDRGGTLVWMGQNYGNLPFLRNSDFSYGNEQWSSELHRLSRDPSSGHVFRKGDLVEVTARQSLFRGGQQNINEAHDTDPSANFEIRLIEADYGLPAPETITLANVMRADDGNPDTREDIFDPTRATGGERYQGLRVRINGLSLISTNGWNPGGAWAERYCMATDGQGRLFPLVCPRYSLGSPPASPFDAVGVFMQESGSASDGTFGYQLFVQEITPTEPPRLSISSDGWIRWPRESTEYRLEFTTNLLDGRWSTVTNAVVLSEDSHGVRWTPQECLMLFRLHRGSPAEKK